MNSLTKSGKSRRKRRYARKTVDNKTYFDKISPKLIVGFFLSQHDKINQKRTSNRSKITIKNRR